MEHLKRAVASGSILWAIALPSAAIAAGSQPHKATYAFALAVYGIGSVICHQLPQRSFHLAAVALPVCARCMGVYIGGAVASLLFAAGRLPRSTRPAQWLVVSALPTLATLGYEWVAGSAAGNWTRAAAGVGLGFTFLTVVLSEVERDGIR